METPEPETVALTQDETLSDLQDQLDELWETYLALLDQYTGAQSEIKKHLSSGFLSLARAQSSAPLGRRYGQDWYDARMKAQRTIQVSTDPVEHGIVQSPTRPQTFRLSLVSKDEAEPLDTAAGEEETAQQPSPPRTPEPEANDDNGNDGTRLPDEKPVYVDVLRWYGILVPSELRQAQSSFCAALDATEEMRHTPDVPDGSTGSPVAKAVNAARELRVVETEIRRLRKAARKADRAHGKTAI